MDDDAPPTQEVLTASSPVITPEHDTGRSCILNFSEGFSESDMEKPRFSFTPAAAKVAYRLSEPDEKPVIEVKIGYIFSCSLYYVLFRLKSLVN